MLSLHRECAADVSRGIEVGDGVTIDFSKAPVLTWDQVNNVVQVGIALEPLNLSFDLLEDFPEDSDKEVTSEETVRRLNDLSKTWCIVCGKVLTG